MKYTLIFSLVIGSFWPIADYISRFSNNSNNKNKALVIASPQRLANSRLLAQEIELLDIAYEKYQAKPDKIKVELNNEKMTETEQLKQNGLLNEVFAGNNILKLKAIIDNGKGQSALIAITNIETNETELKSYQQGQILFGYQLAINTNTQVDLMNNKTKQLINLSMYKINTNQYSTDKVQNQTKNKLLSKVTS
jgi:hypothetical protein